MNGDDEPSFAPELRALLERYGVDGVDGLFTELVSFISGERTDAAVKAAIDVGRGG